MTRFTDSLTDMKGCGGIPFGGYALYLVFSFMTFHSATLTSSAPGIGHWGNVSFSLGVMSARVLACGLCALVVWQLGKRRRLVVTRLVEGSLALVALAAALAGLLVLAMAFSFSEDIDGARLIQWLVVGGALLGCADVLVTLLWARFSATLDLRGVYLYVMLCNGASLLLYLLVTFLPLGFALPLVSVLLFASILMAHRSLARRAEADSGWMFDGVLFREAVRNLWHPVLGTAILCFMGGLMLQISGQQDLPLGEFQQTSLWASGVAILCLLVPAFVVRKPLNLMRIYSIALPLSAAGFLLLPLIWNAAGGIVNAFAQVGAMVASLILWCMLADVAHRTRLSPILLFALALLATNGAQLAGTLVGAVNAATIHQGDLMLTAVALVSVYLLLMAAIVLFRSKGAPQTAPSASAGDGTEKAESPEVVLSRRCIELATRYGFTPRENDIFLLLAQGHTMPAIAERLFVSENTVKSHVKRIYQKLDIHSRSELIDLVNDTQEA